MIVRGDLVASAVCIFIGITFSTLPHWLWWPRLGAPIYIADHDDLLYLSFTGQAYFNHPLSLGDPACTAGGRSLFPWIQFIPGIALARVLGLGPLGVDLIWRIWAGLSIALGFYAVIRYFLPRPAWAAVVTIVLLADIGIFTV
ncbi:MAG: hypothetical protein IRY99_02630 [Isosphaeraceae bacterium]|nr:hypothetical protein [Isosphaeraceae bacterium]